MKTKNSARSFIWILAIICLLSSISQVLAITDDEYVQVYFSMYAAYLQGQPTSFTNQFYDMIVYYLQNEDVNANLNYVGQHSGEMIGTIIDDNGAPCEVINGTACAQDNYCLTEGSTCCCSKKLYSCQLPSSQITGPLQEIIPSAHALIVLTSWSFNQDCAQGCCGRVCCGSTPPTTIPRGDPCTLDAECATYGNHWSCLPFGSVSFCTYTGTFTQCSDGTVIGQCSTLSPGMLCMENSLSTSTTLATSSKCP